MVNPLMVQALMARMRSRVRAERRRRRERDERTSAMRVIDVLIEGTHYKFESVGLTTEDIEALTEAISGAVSGAGPRRTMVPMSIVATNADEWRRCACCGRPPTHRGQASGATIMRGCSWYVRAWVRDPDAAARMAMRLADLRRK